MKTGHFSLVEPSETGTAIDAAGVGTWIWDVPQERLIWSDNFRALFGLTSNATPSYHAMIQMIHPDDRPGLYAGIKDTLAHGVPYDVEYRITWPDSTIHWIATRGQAHFGPAGEPLDMQGVAMDITGRKRAQEITRQREVLEQRVQQLSRLNDDLQQFAYVAAHDLQEPLRMVACYAQLLAQRYEGRLDADADDFIAYAVDGAHRMQHLISDLLAYCSVGTNEIQIRETSALAVLKRALLNLRPAILASGAVITHDQLPIVSADADQLVQVFQNIIGNAIKYRSAEIPRVHISAANNGTGEWIFSVRDNGLGIDPQYFERIFIMFQRLHRRDEFSGTGIGLTLCKKIAERHGGRMWVDSDHKTGSTFYLALPDREMR